MKSTLCRFIPNIHSTNGLLSKSARQATDGGERIPPFFALYTDYQTAGRGMGTNRWFSERGKNLLVSFYFEPHISAAQQFLFNQYFAVTTYEMVTRHIQGATIKWPNDLYIGNKKLAGDLTEHALAGNRIKYTIAGLGLNLNQAWFPEEIPHPTSLFLETGKSYDIHEFLHDYQHLLRNRFDRLYHDATGLKNDYLKNLYQIDEPHAYLIHGERRIATIRNIDDYGRLLLEDTRGTLHTCGFKEVVFLSDKLY